MFKLKTSQTHNMMKSKCGEYLTTGHWLINAAFIRLPKKVHWDVNDRTPEAHDLISREVAKSSRIIERSWLSVQGSEMLLCEGEIVAWADPDYLDMFDNENMTFRVVDELSPIQLWLFDTCIGLLMPQRPPNVLAANKAALVGWLST